MPEQKRIQSNTVTVLSEEERGNVFLGARLNSIVKELYSLVIYDARNQTAYVPPISLDPANRRTSAEYFFTVPPKVHEMTEPFSTTIIPTQDGGRFVESHGSILKEIRISGTTGFRPNKSLQGQDVPLFRQGAVNQANFIEDAITSPFIGAQSQRQTELLKREQTGYDDIVFLKNIFRAYSDAKASSLDSSHLYMIWQNAKDSEYWVVEPKDFRLTQSSGSPLTYNYQIALTTLGKFERVSAALPDTQSVFTDTRTFFARISDVRRAVTSSSFLIASQINRITGFLTFGVDQVLGGANDLVSGLIALRDSQASVASSVRNRALQLRDQLRANIDELSSYPDQFPPQDELLNSMIKLYRSCPVIRADQNIADLARQGAAWDKQKLPRAYDIISTVFNDANAPRTGGDLSFLGNEADPVGYAQDNVHVGDTIKSLAKRLLGSSQRWQILVLANNLKAPYIGPVSKPGILAPGDAILYPSVGGSISVSNANGLESNDAEGTDAGSTGLIQDTYGTDIRLKSVPVTDELHYTDLQVSQGGDVSVITGIPNVKQAMRIKFATERGELPAHPGFGAQVSAGRKSTASSLSAFRINTESTILSDDRISAVKKLNFAADADKLYMEAHVLLKNSSDSITTNFAVRRF